MAHAEAARRWLARLVVATAATAALPAQDAAAPYSLAAGALVERAITPGGSHPYVLALRRGQYAQLTLEQQGADLIEIVTAPDGTTVLEADTAGAEHTPEAVAFIAPADGAFTVTVRVTGKIFPGARYTLKLDAVREPTAKDLRRVAAVRKNADIAKMHPERDTERIRALFLELIEDWQALDEPRLRLWAENYAGYMHGEFMDRHDDAAGYYRRALASARAAQDAFAEAYVSHNLGVVLTRQGRLDEARATLSEVLRLQRAAGHRYREAIALTALGGLDNAAGQPQQALDRLHAALQIHAEIGPPREEAIARLNLGSTYTRLGEYEAALEHYRLALPAFGDDQRLRARTMTQMADAQAAMGERAAARAALHEALAIYRKLQNRALEASTATTLAKIDRDEGQVEAAITRLEEAVAALRASGFRQFEAAARCELGEARRLASDHDAARAAFEEVLALMTEPDSPQAVCGQAGLARVARDVGDLDAALGHVARSLESVERMRGSLAGIRARASSLSRQQALYDLAIEIRMRQHAAEPSAGHDVAALEIAERARARTLLDVLAESGSDVREGVSPALLAEERSLSGRLRARALAQEQALAAGKNERAAGIAREVTLLTAQLAQLDARIRRESPRYAALTRPEPLTVRAIQRDVLDEGTLLLEYALGDRASYLWVVSAATVRSYVLAPGAEIEAAARALYETLGAPPRPAAAVESAAATLSRLVLPAAVGERHGRLLVVAPGTLQYVPFGLVPSPGGSSPLLATHEVVSGPSASVIAVGRAESAARRVPSRTLAVLADPVYTPTDPRVRNAASARASAPAGAVAVPSDLQRALRSTGGAPLARLPFSRREADAIAPLAPAGGVRKALGFEASRETALSADLARYRIVHFAAHGLLDTRRAELSGMVLSLVDQDGRPKDGFLRFHDVYNMNLAADLVVLSGCQTGLGKDLQGEGLVGLTRGFMYAGARRVVASLWQVDDESTAELMSRFYRGMLKEGRPAPAALRQAQLELSRHPRWSAPFYWAGFVLQGEWR
jgi:CHAT domain-containing protein/tetratricopeptide (TPR) repeat protein